MDDYGPTPYSCNNGGRSSQENVTSRPAELAVACVHIKENPSRSWSHVNDLGESNREHAQKRSHGSGAPWSPTAVQHSKDESGWLGRDSE